MVRNPITHVMAASEAQTDSPGAAEMDREIRRADVVIAGGGASGLAAAIELGMKSATPAPPDSAALWNSSGK